MNVTLVGLSLIVRVLSLCDACMNTLGYITIPLSANFQMQCFTHILYNVGQRTKNCGRVAFKINSYIYNFILKIKNTGPNCDVNGRICIVV
jgi:hypothetical protein